MAGGPAYRVRRADFADPLLERGRHDYADAFAVELEVPDAHSAQEWTRAALEGASPAVRRTIRVAQVRALRLQLRPSADTTAVSGWPVVAASSDALHLRAGGPLVTTGDIVGRRVTPRVVVVTTALVFERRSAGLPWILVGALHRTITRHLLRRAAASLTADARQDEVPRVRRTARRQRADGAARTTQPGGPAMSTSDPFSKGRCRCRRRIRRAAPAADVAASGARTGRT